MPSCGIAIGVSGTLPVVPTTLPAAGSTITTPAQRYWWQGVQDGVLGADGEGARAGQAFAEVRVFADLPTGRVLTTGSFGPKDIRVSGGPTMAAWYRVASDKIGAGFGGTFNARGAGFEVQTLLDNGIITASQAQQMVDTYQCLTGEVVELRKVVSQSGPGGTIIESVAVTTSGETVSGTKQTETFSGPIETGLETVTSTITSSSGETTTRTIVPGQGAVPEGSTGGGTGGEDRVQSGLPGGPATVPVPKETAEMGPGLIAGAGAGAGAAVAGLSATASIGVGIAVLAGVLLFLLLSRKDR